MRGPCTGIVRGRATTWMPARRAHHSAGPRCHETSFESLEDHHGICLLVNPVSMTASQYDDVMRAVGAGCSLPRPRSALDDLGDPPFSAFHGFPSGSNMAHLMAAAAEHLGEDFWVAQPFAPFPKGPYPRAGPTGALRAPQEGPRAASVRLGVRRPAEDGVQPVLTPLDGRDEWRTSARYWCASASARSARRWRWPVEPAVVEEAES